MKLRWTDWEPDPAAADGTSPYVDWLRETTFDGQDLHEDLSLAHLPYSRMACGLPPSGRLAGPDVTRAPLPPHARPPSQGDVAEAPDIALTWTPDPDCAVIGIIDSAIALAHERFRRIDGGTRFLSAWIMGAAWRTGSAVPFGREMFRTEIDRLMWRAKRGGVVSEAQFDRIAGTCDFAHPRGDRRLEWRGTHGTSVADLAGGFDMRDAECDARRRRLPLIAVGLPPRTSMGASGSFLEFFAMHAVEYILDRADRIWEACNYGEGGFPIVINLSYGLQAGPKDGHMLIEHVIRAATRLGEERGRPVRVLLPAGNDLDSEGAARFALAAQEEASLGWRIRPEDHTANHAEIWSDRIDGPGAPDASHPALLRLAPPGGPMGPASAGRTDQMSTLVDEDDGDRPIARVYCRRHSDQPRWSDDPAEWHRLVYVLCTRPTLSRDVRSAAPAGDWRIAVTSANGTPIDLHAYVQSDQSLTFGSETGLVSTFAHPEYTRYDESGRWVDLCDYPTDGTPPQITDGPGPVTRFGTLNTIASLGEAAVIGSYRATDGKPTAYTGAGPAEAEEGPRGGPSALAQGEAGAATFGVRAAGSRSGSTVSMSGTSFSTALATRMAALAMLDWIDAGRQGTAPGTDAWFRSRAAADEASEEWPGGTLPVKAGGGRLVSPDGLLDRDTPKPPVHVPPSRMA